MSDHFIPADFVGTGTLDAQSGPASSSTPFQAGIPAIAETLVEANISGPSDENASEGRCICGNECD